jgi:hypothetical protein
MLQWIAILKNVLFLCSEAAKSKEIDYSWNKLYGLIRYYAPDQQKKLQLITQQKEATDQQEEILLEILISTPENERIQIVRHIGEDLKIHFPDACEELCSIENFNSNMPSVRYQKNLKKLNRYISLTDKAIVKGKYYLAYRLTYRCLSEYYKEFLNKHHVQINSKPEDISHTSISVYHYILKYLNKYGSSAPTKHFLYFSMVTHNLKEDESEVKKNKTAEDKKAYELKFDRLYAEYAKDNVQKIIKYISKYF